MSAARNAKAAAAGASAEQAAEAYLQGQGLKTVARNYRSRFGELDLVMRDGAALVFVEVRKRRHRGYADGIESVDRHKQRRLANVAQRYLAWEAPETLESRFDVVAVGERIHWVKDAFTLDDL